MIVIENINSYGRFGNKVLYYLNLRGLSQVCQVPWYCQQWEGGKLFNNKDFDNNFLEKSIIITREEFKQIKIKEIIKYSKKFNIILRPPMLGSVFFSIFKNDKSLISNILSKDINTKNHIGIHFRGTDFKSWNPKSILPIDYYINSIKFIEDHYSNKEEYIICTDDHSLNSIKGVIKYLNDKNIKWSYGPNSNPNLLNGFLGDYNILKSSKFIISSPSTFSITAGILSNANIIHSKNWVNERSSLDDKFWKDLDENKFETYNIFKKI
jgi:hypothetical protein